MAQLYWEITPETWTVDTLRNYHNNGSLNFDPPYQRDLVWNRGTKQRFIWCILRRQAVPAFYVNKVVGRKGAVRYDVIDGKQRMTTVLDFVAGGFAIGQHMEDIDGESVRRKHYDDLSETLKRRLSSYALIVTTIETNDAARIIDQFIDLQRGKPLSGQEKREATPCQVGVITHALQRNAAFERMNLRYDSRRRQLIARLLTLELAARIPNSDPHGEDALDKLYLYNATQQIEDSAVSDAGQRVLRWLGVYASLMDDDLMGSMPSTLALSVIASIRRLSMTEGVDFTKADNILTFRDWWYDFYQNEYVPHSHSWSSASVNANVLRTRIDNITASLKAALRTAQEAI